VGWLARALERLREKRPLVHNITNFVVMNTTANALLAIGASPIMSHAPEDLYDLVKAADAIVLNIGTLDELWIYSMLRAAELAKEHGKPVALDPVGAGATRLRTKAAAAILATGAVKAVRGNFGEASALVGELGKTRGVESAAYDESKAARLALEAARRTGAAVAVSGPVDYVSNGSEVLALKLKEPGRLGSVVGRVTGLGCVATALVGAFLAVEEPLRACAAGLASLKAAMKKAAEEAPYPGTFHVKIYDWLYKLDGDLLEEEVVVERVEAGG